MDEEITKRTNQIKFNKHRKAFGVSERTTTRWLEGVSGIDIDRSPEYNNIPDVKDDYHDDRDVTKAFGISERTSYRWLEGSSKPDTDILPQYNNIPIK